MRRIYARVPTEVEIQGFKFDVIPGIELAVGEHIAPSFYNQVRSTIRLAAQYYKGAPFDDVALTEQIERWIKADFPDRGYFIEVGRSGHENYIQVYDPYPETDVRHHESAANI